MVPRVQPSLPMRLLSGASIAAALAFLTAWAARILPRHGAIDHFNAVRSLDTLKVSPATPYLIGAVLLLVALLALRRRSLMHPKVATWAIAGLLISVAAPLASSVGHQIVIVVSAAAAALLVAAHLPKLSFEPPARWQRYAPWLLWAAVAGLHAVYSMHRHAWYGSGSWDHGCMIHNFYRASRFMSTTSTVLGDVDFLGDHFMLGIYLYAPLTWLNASGYMVLLVQAVNLGAAAPAIYLMARHHRIAFVPSVVLALAVGLSFGLQSAAYFDSHEISVGFGFLAWGVWAFETKRLRAATALLFTFALFKESLGAYVVGLGLLALWRGLAGKDRRSLKYGALWVVGGAVWFVLVNRVFMPTLIARANLPEPHETFADFGPTIFEAAIGMASNPMKALSAIFVPDEKLLSMGVTLFGTGGLALLSPQIGLAALPLFAERLLSSKTTMWEMGYHYAAPLCLYAGWAMVRGWATAAHLLQRGLRGVHRGLMPAATGILTLYVALSALGINGFGYRHPSNYFRWGETYFSTAPRKAAHDGAVALLQDEGRAARLAVQNRLLPHLADRPVIYRLQDWKKADWVVLSVGESAWPQPDHFPRQLARRLARDPGWKLVFSQEGTAIFVRAEVSERPAVVPGKPLGIPASRARPVDSQNPS